MMSKRQIRIIGDIAYVPLTKGLTAMVDVADVAIVDGFNWFSKIDKRCAYAIRKTRIHGKRGAILMHREIAGAPSDMEVDHRDGNGLNNTRANLRLATHAQNTRNARLCGNNKSGLKGVYWRPREEKWMAQISHEGRQYHLGTFATKEAAYEARCAAAEKFHGVFARRS